MVPKIHRVLALICSFLPWKAHVATFARLGSAFLRASRLSSSWPPHVKIRVRFCFGMEARRVIERLATGYGLQPRELTLTDFPTGALTRAGDLLRSRLRRLDLARSAVLSDDLVHLGSLSKLTHLLLPQGVYEDTQLAPLAGGLPCLRVLRAPGMCLREKGILASFPSLTELCIR